MHRRATRLRKEDPALAGWADARSQIDYSRAGVWAELFVAASLLAVLATGVVVARTPPPFVEASVGATFAAARARDSRSVESGPMASATGLTSLSWLLEVLQTPVCSRSAVANGRAA
jgi:hypothetical protein